MLAAYKGVYEQREHSNVAFQGSKNVYGEEAFKIKFSLCLKAFWELD